MNGSPKRGPLRFGSALRVYGLSSAALTAFVNGVLLATFYNVFGRRSENRTESSAATVGCIASLAIVLALSAPAAAIAQSRDANAPSVQTSRAGGVTVTVTPRNLTADAQRWQFEIVFDTHSIELRQDMLTSAALIDVQGRRHAPLAWDGDPPGGHHRRGMLSFAPLGRVEEVRLQIRDVGVPERDFRWSLKSPAR
jgi:hypothetical protein